MYIRFKEAMNYFSSIDLTEEKNHIIIQDFSKIGCYKKMVLNCQKKLSLNYELLDERELTFSIAKIALNYSDEFHVRIMTTIYKILTGDLECPLLGSHWIKIGFQGDDPKNDLRGVGMLGVVQFLYFIERFNFYAKDIYTYSNKDIYSFPMISLFFNFSFICLQMLREGYLIHLCNNKKSVMNALNDFYCGIVEYFFSNYRIKLHTMHQIPDLLKEINTISKNDIIKFFQINDELNKKYPEGLKDSMTLNNINIHNNE